MPSIGCRARSFSLAMDVHRELDSLVPTPPVEGTGVGLTCHASQPKWLEGGWSVHPYNQQRVRVLVGAVRRPRGSRLVCVAC
jgi:hypothetical protein